MHAHTREKVCVWGDKLEVWDSDIHTAVFTIAKWQAPSV